MAKCVVCNSRKGKRKCQATSSVICSQCCGQKRNTAECQGCSWFKDEKESRNYLKVPYISTRLMSEDSHYQDIAQIIEKAISDYDKVQCGMVSDKLAQALVELMLDKYYFGDTDLDLEKPIVAEGFQAMEAAVEKVLKEYPREDMVKVMASIYRSIYRHRRDGERGYLDFIEKFT